MDNKLIETMNEMLKVQGNDGNWNYSDYMHGMYNGMEYMVALVENREPIFRESPEVYLINSPRDYVLVASENPIPQ